MSFDILTLAPLYDGSRIRESSSPGRSFVPRILLAEDDPIICRLLSDVLEDDHFAVDVVFDGEQAWEALNHNHYDLLVTDNQMPHLTGLELIERIRKAGMSLPVVVASGSFSVQSARRYPHLHIAAVIPKPFGNVEFLDTVRNALSGGGVAVTNHATLNRS
jgi:CheY-like chemotaxis protein